MRSKHIAALITFFATFAFSAFIALLFAAPKVYEVPPVKSFNSYHKKCQTRLGEKIRNFLDQDKRNGYERHRYNYSDEEAVWRSSLAERADSITEYAEKSGSMDASDFPRDFQTAWNTHMTAWSNYADFMQNAKNKSMTFEDLDRREDAYMRDRINSTWEEVLETGRNYGADLPAGF